jgi:methylated-DNA-protein-cysteine methyltransferase-like protein
MEQMLENEGVTVKDNQVQNFKALYWDPAIELSL